MAGEIKAERGFFFGEFLFIAPGSDVDIGRRRVEITVVATKEADLVRRGFRLFCTFHREADGGQQDAAIHAKAIKGTRSHQTLDGAAIDLPLVDALDEIKQIRKWLALTRRDDGFDGL